MDARLLELERKLALDPSDIEAARSLAIWLRRSDFATENTAFQGWLEVLKSGSFDDQVGILNRLYELGPVADFAVPSVIDCLHSASVELRQRAAEVLGEIGIKEKECTQDLLLSLVLVASDSTEDLSSIESEPMAEDERKLVAELLMFMNDQEPVARQTAFQVLTKLGHDSAPALLPYFVHENRQSRRILMEVLVAARERAIPTLVLAVMAPRGRARRLAKKIFARLDGRVIPALLERLQSIDDETRRGAARGLLAMGPVARKALPQLRRLGRDPCEAVRCELLAVFEMLGVTAPY